MGKNEVVLRPVAGGVESITEVVFVYTSIDRHFFPQSIQSESIVSIEK